jgi:hypothetical protein
MMRLIEVTVGVWMRAERLTERQRATLEHLRHAQELGSTLSDYAAAFSLNVKELYNGRTQLQRKGLWPRTRHAERAKPGLLAVQGWSLRHRKRLRSGCAG